ncbi:hypothetical protein K227x_28580 [Rubripirellula lacrimiformis]|uniref:Methyltransferase domain-containing protein n=1 Tax=Rubripirellula lacrimiformis TaxID=1930273 RepID=A0A517NBG6_9BACT|nr:methyltransferase domain-containing protein [Rubripirellula lacrimiformis]QDT04467.1 hypothetical protein K227x_28580 [Rubripirellula lacrimiformis]
MLSRDRHPDWMSHLDLPLDLQHQTLNGFSRLNRYTGVASAMYRYVRRAAIARGKNRGGRNVLRVLDIASGAGEVPIAWCRRAAIDGIPLKVTATDICPAAIDQQQRRAEQAGVPLNSIQLDCLASPLPAGFDLVTCSMFMHRLDNHHATRLLQAMQAVTDEGILICDWDRSRINLVFAAVASHLISRSRIVHHDAGQAVRAAFTADEFKRLSEHALARPVRVRRGLPCRYIIGLDEKSVPETAVAFA